MNFDVFAKVLGKTWYLWNSKKPPFLAKNQRCLRNVQKVSKIVKNGQNGLFWHFHEIRLSFTVNFSKIVSFDMFFVHLKKWQFWPVWYLWSPTVSKRSLVNPSGPLYTVSGSMCGTGTVVQVPGGMGYGGVGRPHGGHRGTGPGQSKNTTLGQTKGKLEKVLILVFFLEMSKKC